MFNIRDALNSLPAKPVLIIAPIIALVVLGIYYAQLREDCIAQSGLRDQLAQRLQAGARIVLTDVTDFSWDEVQLLSGVRPKGKTPDCPFGWGWTREYRNLLASRDQLHLLVFSREGKVTRFIELDGNLFGFGNGGDRYSRSDAVFNVQVDATERRVLIPSQAQADR